MPVFNQFKYRAGICSGLTLLLISFFTSADAEELSDIEKARQMHETFWSEVVKNYAVKERTQANSRESVLTDLEIYQGRLKITGTTPIVINLDLAPYFRNFSYLEIEGEGLDQIQSAAYKNARGIVYTNPQLQSARFMQIPGSLYADWHASNQTIVLEGEAVITGIRLVSLEGIASSFDESSFLLPKSSQPPINAILKVDARRCLSLDGVTELPTERFFRLYFSPGGERSGWEEAFAKKGFYGGRQMTKLAHELETRHGTFKPPLLKEDPLRKGYADLSIFEARNFSHFAKVDPELKFAHCLNIWPSFMKVEIEGKKNVLGTPAIEHFPAAAELAAAYIADEIKDSGRTANYWEVKNESDIPHEWTYHGVGGLDSWTLLGEFHNAVANSIKAVDPGILVGGPASAWPRMEMGGRGFKVWENHRRFMTVTQDDLDFYSHHFYEVGVNSSHAARTEGYEDWLQGRLDCVLDMVAAEMHNKDDIKPLLITEYGTLQGGVREIDYWLRVSNYSSFMMQFMERPADFELTVPFLLGYMHWEPDSGYALLHKDKEGSFQLTKNSYLLDLWEGVGGHYLYLEQLHPKIHSLGWKKGKRIYLAINNQSGRDLNLKPELLLPAENKLQSIQYRHPSYQNGQFLLLRGSLIPGQDLTISNAETAVIELQTEKEIPTEGTIHQHSYYADQTAIFPSDDAKLKILVPDLEPNKLQSATLRIGFQNAEGPSGELRAKLNGKRFTIDLDAFKNIENFFEYIDVQVPVHFVQKRNRLTLDFPKSNTIVSHAKFILHSIK
jgi:agarase